MRQELAGSFGCRLILVTSSSPTEGGTKAPAASESTRVFDNLVAADMPVVVIDGKNLW
jgi:hypothetical protein